MKSLRFAALVALLLVSSPACFTIRHTVGAGPTGAGRSEQRVWYLLWGLVPLSGFDSNELAGSATSYRVTSQWAALDILINFFTSAVSITSRTVTVER
ncbi:MAG: Bor/Iss family lipoprotein [Planctomycetota bacterium]